MRSGLTSAYAAAAMLAVTACRSPSGEPPAASPPAAPTPTTTAAPAAAAETATTPTALESVDPTADKSAPPTKPNTIHWQDSIAWQPWEQALAQAKAENKSICLVLYANWCPRCRELAPVFATPAVASAAERLLMVRQDDDENAPWVRSRFGDIGRYVPRIFFLNPDGTLNQDLVSGHPRYPYFYSPHVTETLIANMHRAAGG